MDSRKLFKALTALVAVIALAAPAVAQVSPTGSWSAKTPTGVLTMGSEGSGTSDGTYMWYVGGNGNPYGTQRYDPASNTIWQGAQYIGYPYYHATGNIGGPGGSNYTNSAYGNGYIYRYNIATNQWSQSVASNSTSWRSAACSGNSKIWFSGGGQSSTAMQEFDGTTLSSKTNLPISMTAHLMAFVPTTGLIYLVGGNFGGNLCYEFNPTANTYTQRANRPTTTAWGTTGFSLKSRVYSLTGSDATVYEFAPTANVWTQRASTPTSGVHQYMAAGGTLGVTKGYAWGGNSTTAISEFIPPSFGTDPTDPPLASVKQVGSLGVTAQAGANQAIGWTDSTITFQADVTDVDLPAQQVALEVEVRSSGGAWGSIPILNSGLKGQGTIQVPFNIPAGGDYDWRYRVRDDYDNYTPNVGGIPGWFEFMKNAVTADFRSDQVPPTIPVQINPNGYDIDVPSMVSGSVQLNWLLSTDNGPASAITYEVQVSFNDPTFGNIAASQVGIVPTSTSVTLNVSQYNYSWHVRAKDIGGNVSAWSPTMTFRVVSADGIDHSAGDAMKVCGMSAPIDGSSTGLLLGAALTLLAGLRRRK